MLIFTGLLATIAGLYCLAAQIVSRTPHRLGYPEDITLLVIGCWILQLGFTIGNGVIFWIAQAAVSCVYIMVIATAFDVSARRRRKGVRNMQHIEAAVESRLRSIRSDSIQSPD